MSLYIQPYLEEADPELGNDPIGEEMWAIGLNPNETDEKAFLVARQMLLAAMIDGFQFVETVHRLEKLLSDS